MPKATIKLKGLHQGETWHAALKGLLLIGWEIGLSKVGCVCVYIFVTRPGRIMLQWIIYNSKNWIMKTHQVRFATALL